MEDNQEEQSFKELDRWQMALNDPLAKLEECQVSLNLESCTKCDKLLECMIRDTYVSAVYESMNKGSGGGFEF